MTYSKEELTALLTIDEFPRSASYDPVWMLENTMGPNAVWLVEALSQVLNLQPGMRVMDLGCGKAISSIFLAREFQLQVWATDLWISPGENWLRIRAANAGHQVFPIYAEAHALPFANDFFDALVSLDAYHYFGTDDLYLSYVSRFVRPGGSISIVVPGISHEFNAGLPAHLSSLWPADWWSFHSPDWWRSHWEKTGLVNVEVADFIPDGWKYWLKWMEVCRDAGFRSSEEDIAILRADAGQTLGFTRMVAHKK